MDAQGQLVTSNGFPISPAVTLPANAQSVTIAQDGTISVTLQGSAIPQQVGSLRETSQMFFPVRLSSANSLELDS
jgi:flagellar basal-body rod protein FlgG